MSFILGMVAVISLFMGGRAIGGAEVSIVRTWPARSGPALSSDDVLKVTEIGGVSVQPGGRLVSYTTLSADPDCNCYHVELNLLNLRSGDIRVVANLGQPFRLIMPSGLIVGTPIVAESLWSADGRYLAYIVNREGHGTLCVYDTGNGRSKNVDLNGDEPFGFVWSSVGDSIVYQTGGASPASVRWLKQGDRDGYLYGSAFSADPEEMPIIPWVPAVPLYKVYHGAYGHDTAWSDLRVVDVISGARREATPAEHTYASRAEFSYSHEPNQDATEVKSADGRFTIRLQDPELGGPGRSISISERGRTRTLRKASSAVCPGERTERSVALAYWDDITGRFVIICSKLGPQWRVGAPGDIVSLDPVSGRSHTISSISATNAEEQLGRQCDLEAGKMICVREQPSEPPQLVAVDLMRRKFVNLYDPNEALRQRAFPRVDRLAWKNSDGLPNQADLVYPYNYRSDTQYPLVITQYTDGGFLRGNTGDENPDFAYAQAGFFVLNFMQTQPAPEKHGLSFLDRMRYVFRGRKWEKSIQDSLDIVIQNLIDRGLVNPARVAYTGLSGGSNQIDYALANGRRMAVVITSTCCIGPHTWVTNPLNSDFYSWFDVENPAVDRNRTKWSTISPTLHIQEIHAAILANVSEHERIGFQPLWALMKYAHKPMETYIYSREYHIKFQPEHLSAIQHRNIDWLRFWLQGYEDADPAKAEQYARWHRLRDDWCRYDTKCIRTRATVK